MKQAILTAALIIIAGTSYAHAEPITIYPAGPGESDHSTAAAPVIEAATDAKPTIQKATEPDTDQAADNKKRKKRKKRKPPAKHYKRNSPDNKDQQPVRIDKPIMAEAEADRDPQLRGDHAERGQQLVIDELNNEIHSLKNELALTGKIQEATKEPATAASLQAITLFNYVAGSIYAIDTAPDHFTDIFLQPGEIYQDVGAGDTSRWLFSKSVSGDGDNKQTHILIKPLEADLSTNFAIYTNRHVYHIKARSTVAFYTPQIAWTYPVEEKNALIAMNNEEQRKEDLQPNQKTAISPENIHFNYEIKGDKYPWRPERVMDDGMKTYIEMPPTMKSSEAPVLFIVDGKGELNIVNYRVSGSYYVVDRLFEEARMQLSDKEVIKIKRK